LAPAPRPEYCPAAPLVGVEEEIPTVPALAYPAFDADNHYYEALDAFTRHLDPRHGPRTIQWAEVGGRKYHLVAGRLSRAVVNPTFDPVAKPGAMHDYFRGNPEGRSPLEFLRDRERIRPEYRDRDARLRTLDAHGLEAVWLFPTLGVLYEELLKHDPEAVTITFRAFNRWLEEDWGFAHQGRIFAAPYLTLADVGWAVEELEWALARGARIVCMRPAAALTADGPRSPADPCFDPFWARVAEAGITVVAHAADSGYSSHGYARDGFSSSFDDYLGPNVKLFHIERAIHDFLATLVFERLFERFPNLRVASVENGSEFLPALFRKLRGVAHKYAGWFQADPVETFRRHVWVNPFWEDDVREVVAHVGPERVIFGSDWPHIEGMPLPLDYVPELAPFDDAARRRILRDNARELNTLHPS
jgi:predicted TIM-barrel fold metal-dependent hydrolase